MTDHPANPHTVIPWIGIYELRANWRIAKCLGCDLLLRNMADGQGWVHTHRLSSAAPWVHEGFEEAERNG